MIINVLVLNTSAQETDSIKNRPGQISFFYPLGTNGINAFEYSNNFSLNVLFGINGGVNGFELGGIANTNLGNVNGVQIGGIANINTQKANGVILGGIANVIRDTSYTISAAGISNVFGKGAIGAHFGGVSNMVNGDFIGAQFGGIANVTNGDVTGIQAAGISNVGRGDFIGLQLGGISNHNFGNLLGAQIGLINSAKNITGFQLGLINIAENYEGGVPFGLISFVKNGYHAIEANAGESIYGGVNLKLGVDHLYTIYKIGLTANAGTRYLTYGLGFGTKLNFTEKIKLSIDLSSNSVAEPNTLPRFDLLAKSDFGIRYQLAKNIDVFAGPSFNVFVTEQLIGSNETRFNIPYTLYGENWNNNQGSTSIWIGANAGVSIQF